MGDFEHALVFYHRGCKIRPELHEFTLGVQKSQEAINNSIGCKFTMWDTIITNYDIIGGNFGTKSTLAHMDLTQRHIFSHSRWRLVWLVKSS